MPFWACLLVWHLGLFTCVAFLWLLNNGMLEVGSWKLEVGSEDESLRDICPYHVTTAYLDVLRDHFGDTLHSAEARVPLFRGPGPAHGRKPRGLRAAARAGVRAPPVRPGRPERELLVGGVQRVAAHRRRGRRAGAPFPVGLLAAGHLVAGRPRHPSEAVPARGLGPTKAAVIENGN